MPHPDVRHRCVPGASIKPSSLIAIGGLIVAAFTLVTCPIVPNLAGRFLRRRTLAALLAETAIGLPLVFLGIGGVDFALSVAGLVVLALSRVGT